MIINKQKLVIIIFCVLVAFGFVKFLNKSKTPEKSAGTTTSVVSPSPSPTPDKSLAEEDEKKCHDFLFSLATGDMVTMESKSSDFNGLDNAENGGLDKTKDIIKQLNEGANKGLDLKDQIEGLLSVYVMGKTQYSVDGKTKNTYGVISADCPDFYTASILVVVDNANKKVIGILADQSLSVSAFSDLDGDGNLELLIKESNGANCWICGRLELYRIVNGTLKYINLAPSLGIQEIVPSKNKMIPGFTVRVLDTTWEFSGHSHAEGIGLTKYFRINGEKIEDITKEYKDEIIGDSNEPSYNILNTLLAYESIGERAKGMEIYNKECLEKITETKDTAGKEELNKDLSAVKKQYKESDHFYPPLGVCKTQNELYGR